MKTKHKLIQDFQFISIDKKIFVLKSGTILEEYNYKIKNDIIPIDKDIVNSNPLFFELIDWKSELMLYMRQNKMPQPAQLGKKMIPFIEEMILSSLQQNSVNQTDDSFIKELEKRELELLKKESELSNKIKSFDNELLDKRSELEIWEKRLIELENSLRSPELPSVAVMPK